MKQASGCSSWARALTTIGMCLYGGCGEPHASDALMQLPATAAKEAPPIPQQPAAPASQTVLPAAGDAERRELAELYRELMKFKNQPDFAEVGFSPCCAYDGWFKRVEALRDRCSLESWLRLGALPGDLLQLGLEYVSSKGRATKYTRYMVPEFEAALRNKPRRKSFDRRLSRADRYCRNLSTYEQWMKLMLVNDYAAADRVLSNDAACPHVPQNTPMRGPLESKRLGDETYELMEAQGFGKVWVAEGNAESATN